MSFNFIYFHATYLSAVLQFFSYAHLFDTVSREISGSF